MSEPTIGEQYNISGHHNTGKKVTNYGASTGQVSLHDLLAAAAVLRDHLPVTDRALLDDYVETVKSGDAAKRRIALSNIAGIATVVGQVGVPVIEAVRKVLGAIGG